MIEKNAIITDAIITTENHGILSALIMLKYDGASQGFGDYVLYSHQNLMENPGNYAGLFIWRCMEIADVSEWSKMVGKAIRVRKKNEFDSIDAIGHIIEDKWFCPEQEFTELRIAFHKKAE